MSAGVISRLAIVTALLMACSSLANVLQPTPAPILAPTPGLTHFENDILSFDYPANLRLYPAGDSSFHPYPDIDLGGELVVGLGDPRFFGYETYHRFIRFARLVPPPGSQLQDIMFDTYRRAEQKYPPHGSMLKAGIRLAIDGRPCFEKRFGVYSGEPAYDLRDIWIELDDQILILSIWTQYTDPQDYEAFQAGAEALVESVRIK